MASVIAETAEGNRRNHSVSEDRSFLYVSSDRGRQSDNPSIRNKTQACPPISVAEELLIYMYLRIVHNGPYSEFRPEAASSHVSYPHP
jgi:hypothetical protein